MHIYTLVGYFLIYVVKNFLTTFTIKAGLSLIVKKCFGVFILILIFYFKII